MPHCWKSNVLTHFFSESLPCVDNNPDCDKYPPGICTDASYTGWARQNCRQFCNLCQSKSWFSSQKNQYGHEMPPLQSTGQPTASLGRDTKQQEHNIKQPALSSSAG